MPSRKKVKKSSPNADVKFANWLAQVCNLLLTKFCYLILGRASSKTTEFQVERLMEIATDMPGAPACWVSDTYSNLQKNVLPSLMEGLERKGWRKGEHYVLETRPPEFSEAEKAKLPAWLRSNFWKPYNQLASYKHTMIFYTGFNIRFGSLDRPASLAGPSYVHVFGDEVKYFKEERILNLFKAVRGYKQRYGHSVFYLGHTMTTDMPNPGNVGEYDWVLSRGKEIDPEAIKLVLQAALVMNEAAGEYAAALEAGDKEEAAKKKRTFERWQERWILTRLRPEAHRFFFIASSYINVDYLSIDWFADAIKDAHGDLVNAILSCKASLSSGDRFYANVQESHYYKDGIDERAAERFGLLDKEDCRVLKYLDRTKIIEMSLDFGNMNSMTIMQPKPGNVLRILKFMYSLSPNHLRHLADEFLDYFEPHQEKTIHLYYDRSGNNYEKTGEDNASKIKHAIEYRLEVDDSGKEVEKRTKWKVRLMSRGEGNIPQHEEYTFMQEFFAGTTPGLPKPLIDYFQCKPLRSSLQLAPTKVVNRGGKSFITKEKKSERLPIHRLVMESTNPSDAFKYGVMRKPWRKLIKKKRNVHTGSVSTY